MIALISDIHGNYPALQAVLREIDRLNCASIISLGDVAGYYCMLNECIEELKARKIVNLRGNHDDYLLSGKGCPRSQSASRCLAFQERSLGPAHRQWLEQSLMFLTLGEASLVHGGWIDPLDEYLYDLQPEYFTGRPGRFFFSGHTHVQVLADLDGRIYCNPGSVGQPRDGDPRAAYALWDGAEVTLKRVEYDVDSMCRRMRDAGFESHYYQNLLNGTRIGGGTSTVSVQTRASDQQNDS
jgi:putative phosphoesterase